MRRNFFPRHPNPQLYLCNILKRDLTKANFDWNQLSRVSIGFSPLCPGHTNQQTRNCFGPPRNLTSASACPGIDQLVSGFTCLTKGSITTLVLKFATTRFPYDFRLAKQINSLVRYSERTQQRRNAATSYNCYVSDLFRAFYGLFSTFPHGTNSLSVLRYIQVWR